MKILLALKEESLLVGRKEREYNKDDGSKGTSYSIAVINAGEACNFSCTKDVYEYSKDVLMQMCGLTAEYDTNYKSFKCVGIMVHKK